MTINEKISVPVSDIEMGKRYIVSFKVNRPCILHLYLADINDKVYRCLNEMSFRFDAREYRIMFVGSKDGKLIFDTRTMKPGKQVIDIQDIVCEEVV